MLVAGLLLSYIFKCKFKFVTLYPNVPNYMELKKVLVMLAAIAILWGCSTPTNIVYMQDVTDDAIVQTIQSNPVRLKPMDQISVVVSCREPQIAAMFNLPYYAQQLGSTGSNLSSGGGGRVSGYTVDIQGNIDFPILGKIHVGGLTRAEATEHIKHLLVESNQIKDPVVTVEFMNLGFSILGEVKSPGRYTIDRDEFTILDAISRAGDLNIDGQRENITVIRDFGTSQERFYRLDLTNAASVFNSPAYFMEQGDVIYVTPNPKRRRESTVMSNSAYTPTFWISLASSVITLTSTLVVLLSR